MHLNPLDLVAAAPWKRAAFTTFALSLSFFEAVLLDRLLRGGGREALILADPEGIRAGLSEQGARRAGRDYEIEPVACTTGVFHPKLSALISESDAHLLVGSGNLTFGGWGGNLETIEHLHPSFAADAIEDAADFFELLTLTDTIITDAAEDCATLAAALRSSIGAARRTGAVRLSHSVGGSIANDIERYADELGGAVRLTAISPFFDRAGGGLGALSKTIGCSDVRIHVHPAGAVAGRGALAWPFDTRERFKPVDVADYYGADRRLLHAKSLEIICRRGRLIVSGSANATHAALYGGNVEASVIRIQRETVVGWRAVKAAIPDRSATIDDEEGEDELRTIGVLSATLQGDAVVGRILTPRLQGKATATIRTIRSSRPLGETLIDADGRFKVAAPGIEMEAWESGRLVVRIEAGANAAEGFVSIAAASELIRRAGPMASRIFAILAGNDTPADVAAILAWFREDPARIPRSNVVGGGAAAEGDIERATFVPLAALQGGTSTQAGSNSVGGSTEPAWRHAMALLRSAFATPRGPWGTGGETDDDDDDDQADREKRTRQAERLNLKSLERFDELLTIMLAPGRQGADASIAHALAHFLTDRIRPPAPKVRLWLGQILNQWRPTLGEGDLPVIASTLISFASDHLPEPAGRARRFLVSRGVDLASIVVDVSSIPAFIDLLGPELDLAVFLEDVRSGRTPGEQVRAYLTAASPMPIGSLPSLERSSHWRALERAIGDPILRERFMIVEETPRACPRCNMTFPRVAVEDLRQLGVAMCCGRLILNRAI